MKISGSKARLKDGSVPSLKYCAEVLEHSAYSELLASNPEIREAMAQYPNPEDIKVLHEDGTLAFVLKAVVEAKGMADERINEAVTEATQNLIQEIAYLEHQLSLVDKERAFDEAAEGLSLLEKAKLASLTEHVIFSDDPDTYKQTISRIRNQHLSRPTLGTTGILAVDESDIEEISISSQMRPYLKALEKIR